VQLALEQTVPEIPGQDEPAGVQTLSATQQPPSSHVVAGQHA
jgi:hypothetical protein